MVPGPTPTRRPERSPAETKSSYAGTTALRRRPATTNTVPAPSAPSPTVLISTISAPVNGSDVLVPSTAGCFTIFVPSTLVHLWLYASHAEGAANAAVAGARTAVAVSRIVASGFLLTMLIMPAIPPFPTARGRPVLVLMVARCHGLRNPLSPRSLWIRGQKPVESGRWTCAQAHYPPLCVLGQ